MRDDERFGVGQHQEAEGASGTEGGGAQLPKGLEAGIGLAVASFVLGLVSLPLALFVIGAVTGLIGFVLAVIHLSKKLPWRRMAICGLVLSGAGLIGGTGLGILYGINIYRSVMTAQEWEDSKYAEYIGKAAPEMTVTDLEGNKIVLSELKGRRVVLDFWATWCPPCRKEIPHFIELRKTSSPEELVIVGISNESAEVVRSFAEKEKINYVLAASDEKLPGPYGEVTSIPTTFFIDANGVIESVLTGYHSLEELRVNALGERTGEVD